METLRQHTIYTACDHASHVFWLQCYINMLWHIDLIRKVCYQGLLLLRKKGAQCSLPFRIHNQVRPGAEFGPVSFPKPLRYLTWHRDRLLHKTVSKIQHPMCHAAMSPAPVPCLSWRGPQYLTNKQNWGRIHRISGSTRRGSLSQTGLLWVSWQRYSCSPSSWRNHRRGCPWSKFTQCTQCNCRL